MIFLNNRWRSFLSASFLPLALAACGQNAPMPLLNTSTGSFQSYGSPMMGFGAYTMMGGQGCIPLNGMPISFSAVGAWINAKTLKAGVIPVGQDPYQAETPGNNVFGQVLSGGMIGGNYLTGNANMNLYGIPITNRLETDGSLQVSVSPMALGNPAAPVVGGPANISGQIFVSQTKAALINATQGGSSSYFFSGNMPTFTSACVSQIALSMSYVYVGGQFTFNGGKVFLYLNGTQGGTYLFL